MGSEEVSPTGETQSRVEAALDTEIKIAFLAVVVAVLVLLVFLFRFAAWPVGGPSDFGTFGDYFGGLVNPVVGIVTVLLVVRTLKATREEAADTRAQLEAQLRHMSEERADAQRAERLEELRKRIAGALLEWHRECEVALPEALLIPSGSRSYEVDYRLTTAGAVVRSASLLRSLGDRNAGKGPPRESEVPAQWRRDLAPAAALLSELSVYIAEYEAEAGGVHLADFYRRRFQMAAAIFFEMGLISRDVVKLLSPRVALPLLISVEVERAQASLDNVSA